MIRPLIVGQNPSFKTQDNSSLRRLAGWMTQAGVDHWSFVNVSDRPGTFAPSKEDRHFLWMCLKDSDQPILALGHRASQTLDRLQIPHVRIHHPSGLNRALNDPREETFTILQIKCVVCNERIPWRMSA